MQRFLTMRMLSGPAIALPGTPRRWLLLAGAADEAPQAMIDWLTARDGITHRAGALVPLPPSRLACGQVTWQVPPALVDPWLPPLTAPSRSASTTGPDRGEMPGRREHRAGIVAGQRSASIHLAL